MYPSRSMLASLALSIAALINPALAADSKTMSGSACHLARGSQAKEVYRSSNLIFNLGNAEESVACPAVKDLNKIKSAVVRVIDHNPDPNADIFCSLDTLRSDGTQLSRQNLRSSGSSADVRQLSFGAQAAAANGSYYLTCILPPYHQPTLAGSAIVNFTVVED
jgi:hypothetical protein